MHISPQEARKIVDALACGVDPETGELLDASASHAALNSPRTVRALFLASRVLRSYYEDTGEDAYLMEYRLAGEAVVDDEETVNRIAQCEES